MFTITFSKFVILGIIACILECLFQRNKNTIQSIFLLVVTLVLLYFTTILDNIFSHLIILFLLILNVICVSKILRINNDDQ